MSRFPAVLAEGAVRLTIDPTRLLLCFRAETAGEKTVRKASRADIDALVKRLGLSFEDDPWAPPGPPGAARRLNHTYLHVFVIDAGHQAISDARLDAMARERPDLVRWIGPVYVWSPDSARQELACPLPSTLLVGLRGGIDAAEEARLLAGLRSHGLVEQPARSKALRHLRVFELADPMQATAYDVRDRLVGQFAGAIERVLFEHMPWLSPRTHVPDDELFVEQWNLTLVHAPEAWDISRGRTEVVVAVIDSGCDLGHPDLQFMGRGINTGDMTSDGGPTRLPDGSLEPHGTYSAGVAAATIDNALGVAGIAGRCRVLPIATPTTSDVESAAAIRYAIDAIGAGVRVANISQATFDPVGLVWDAVIEAHTRGLVICASAGNGDRRGLIQPAEFPFVMACGGSDESDGRWSVLLSDGTRRGSNYGDSMVRGTPSGVSVVAPAWNVTRVTRQIGVPTTDIRGLDGFPALPSPRGDYLRLPGFTMTSAAAPHVAGVAALLASTYPTLDGNAIRRIIERTAEKVGPIPYAVVDGYPNGTRNEQMGYGRLNAFHALDLGDVVIRDWRGDSGLEPSQPPGGDFWSTSDIAVRPGDDGVFLPENPDESSLLTVGVDNYVYVKVVNAGPSPARNVVVQLRAALPSTAFRYPTDWHASDASHVAPDAIENRYPLVAASTFMLAKFRFTMAQVDGLAEWTRAGSHPCLLAEVVADNDYAFTGAVDAADALLVRRNNLAQRNLGMTLLTAGEARIYRFAAGDRGLNANIWFSVDPGALAADGRVELIFDQTPLRIRKLEGASASGNGRVVITAPTASLMFDTTPGAVFPMTLQCTPSDRARKDDYHVVVSQRDAKGTVVGGVTMVLRAPRPRR